MLPKHDSWEQRTQTRCPYWDIRTCSKLLVNPLLCLANITYLVFLEDHVFCDTDWTAR